MERDNSSVLMQVWKHHLVDMANEKEHSQAINSKYVPCFISKYGDLNVVLPQRNARTKKKYYPISNPFANASLSQQKHAFQVHTNNEESSTIGLSLSYYRTTPKESSNYANNPKSNFVAFLCSLVVFSLALFQLRPTTAERQHLKENGFSSRLTWELDSTQKQLQRIKKIFLLNSLICLN